MSVEVLKEVVVCDHCGEQCKDVLIVHDHKKFCCQGCQTVYNLLHDCELEQFYTLDDTSVNSLKNIQLESYAYLNEEHVKKAILDFEKGDLAKVRFYIPAIHCSSCLWLLENLYKIEEGISSSKVNFLKKEVAINFNPQLISLQKLAALLHTLAYPPKINLHHLEEQEQPSIDRSLYYKLGITGFLFGNIMLLSFPEYLGLNKAIDPGFFNLFGYINILLAIPLVFYSGWDYLKSAAIGLYHGHLNIDVPISIGILTLFIRSVYEILSHSGGAYLDALAGLLFFLLIGKWFQQITYNHISFERDYQSYFPVSATKLVNDIPTDVSLKKLQKGDQVLVRHGELIPADGILLNGKAEIDYSFVTGESMPVGVKIGEAVYAGGKQKGGKITLLLEKKVEQSYLVELWNDQIFKNKNAHPSASKLANLVGTYFTIGILLIAFSTLFFWMWKDSPIAINAFTSVLIIACPCAVALAIPFTFGNALRLLAAQHIYLKNTAVLEEIQSLTHIVFDKTGTLTSNQSHIQLKGSLSEPQKEAFALLAQQSGHPISKKIVEHLGEPSKEMKIVNFKETLGKGIEAYIDGQYLAIQKASDNRSTALIWGNQEIAHYTIQPILRKNTPQLLKELSQKYQLYLLTGDNSKDKKLFENLFPNAQHLSFHQSPHDKLAFIKALQAKGGVVMMVGDGLNDAGALQQANVGLVLSEDQNNFSPACDGVMHATQFENFPSFLKYCIRIKYVVFACYSFALLYNIVGLSFAIRGLLSPVIAAILMPLSSISIVLVGLFGSYFLYTRYLQKSR